MASTSMLPAGVDAAAVTDAASGQVDVHKLRKALSKYALPSAGELRHLRAADPTTSYRSSFFRLQVDELLAAVQSSPGGAKAAQGVQALLFEVKTALEALGEQQVTHAALRARGLPVRNHVKRKEIVLPFRKPARLDIVGSYILNNMAFTRKGSAEYAALSVDVAVEMPQACFLPKDFGNYRYADKRSLYLGVLAAELQARTERYAKVTLAGFNGDGDKPVAVVHVDSAHLAKHHVKCARFSIRIIPVVTTELFKLSKLAPSRNNIRHEPDMTEEQMKACRSPHYNNAILEDMMMRQHTRELHAALKSSPSFAEACVLIKVWVRQRGFHRAPDSINGFLACMLLLFLLQTKRINAQTPSDQMFKVFVQFIAVHELEKEPLLFPPAEGAVVLTSEGMQVFQSAFELVFIDSSGRLNLFGRVTRSAWQELQLAAKESARLVQHGSMDDFRALFIKKNEFWTRYDQYFWLPAPIPVDDDAHADAHTEEERRSINDMGLERFWMRKLQSVVAQAVTDRAHLVRPYVDDAGEWTLDDDGAESQSYGRRAHRKVAIGLRVNPDSAGRIVDKGPSADDKDASAAFRRFWRGKSELRRFKDGAIVEAVVWDDISAEDRHLVLDSIIKYIVPAHCPHVSASRIKTSNAALYTALDVHSSSSKAALASQGVVVGGSSFESTMTSVSKLWVVFNTFAKTLRDLDSLPLKVSDVQPVHPGFRYTSLFPVEPHPLAFSKGEKVTTAPAPFVSTVLEPLELFVRFERSSSWPNDKDALRHAKTGFYVHIAHELETRHGIRCDVSIDSVDVMLSGYVFRLVIRSEKEIAVETGAIGARKMTLVHSPAYVTAKREADYISKHASQIHALHTKNTSFGPTVRLVRRWLASKFLSNALRVEAVELLVADVFVAPDAPHSILSGFLRVLKRIASFDWQQMPLIVDLNGGFQDEDRRREAFKRFDASAAASASSSTHHPAMFIAADYEDVDCLSSWTRFSPDRIVVQRVVSLAQRSYEAMVHWLAVGASSSGWQTAFASSRAEFDAVLSLATDRLPSKKLQRVDGEDNLSGGKKKSKKHHQPFVSPVYKNMNLAKVPVHIGLDPVRELVADLERRLGHVAFFFVNDVDAREIMVAWRPTAFLPGKFRAITSSGLAVLPSQPPAEEDETLSPEAAARSYAIPNVFELLSEMRRLGDGMVSGISLQPFESDQ